MNKESHSSLSSYLLGFMLSLLLTGTVYIVATRHLFDGGGLVLVIMILALAQALTQLMLFLHLGQETKPRWKLGVFLFMLMVLLILVGGSLWIMQNLNYNMAMPATDTMKDERIYR
ncbi:MAG TPA: cytochrome o ubiquinol oxidase subunit IV [Patescibacteria group bacterium]|nr:cytochrome o ubiquinol oxidase subunit IV [Patescibacteria group bacterium]